jgi:hypothetical protein
MQKNKSDTGNNGGNWNHLKLIRKYLSNRPGKHEIKEELEKTATLGTAHTYCGKC